MQSGQIFSGLADICRSEFIRCNNLERRVIAMQNHLALVLEIHRHAGTDDRLDLAKPPVGVDEVAHNGTDFQKDLWHGGGLA